MHDFRMFVLVLLFVTFCDLFSVVVAFHHIFVFDIALFLLCFVTLLLIGNNKILFYYVIYQL